MDLEQLRADWPTLSREQKIERFNQLPREDAEDLFLSLSPADQSEIIQDLLPGQRRSWLRLLALDDVADVLQNMPVEIKEASLDLLDAHTRREVRGLLAYAEDDAGGLMTPRFVRLRPDMLVEEAIRYLRMFFSRHEETIYYSYVVDRDDHLLGVISFRELLMSPSTKKLEELMKRDYIWVPASLDQEELSRIFNQHHLSAIPVLDEDRRIQGVVTYDDIAEVAIEEATEDIQKLGGMEALDLPYWKTSFLTMIRKRAGWLILLFLGSLFTTIAMSHYESEIAKAALLILFVPLIISSGGNSGSQATTLIIRALALEEIQLRDWWRVFFRELMSGLALGLILGFIGWARIMIWPPDTGQLDSKTHMMIASTVAFSLVGVVLWGSMVGSMLPFIFKRFGLDSASASAPLVATVVDVTGLVIYFTAASMFLTGLLL